MIEMVNTPIESFMHSGNGIINVYGDSVVGNNIFNINLRKSYPTNYSNCNYYLSNPSDTCITDVGVVRIMNILIGKTSTDLFQLNIPDILTFKVAFTALRAYISDVLNNKVYLSRRSFSIPYESLCEFLQYLDLYVLSPLNITIVMCV